MSRISFRTKSSFQLPHYVIQIDIRSNKFQCPSLNLRQINNIIHQLKQQLIIVFYDTQILLTFFVRLNSIEYAGKSNNRIQWSTYFMAYISYKCRLKPICFFSFFLCNNEFLLHLFPVSNDQNRTNKSKWFPLFIHFIDYSPCLYPIIVFLRSCKNTELLVHLISFTFFEILKQFLHALYILTMNSFHNF